MTKLLVACFHKQPNFQGTSDLFGFTFHLNFLVDNVPYGKQILPIPNEVLIDEFYDLFCDDRFMQPWGGH